MSLISPRKKFWVNNPSIMFKEYYRLIPNSDNHVYDNMNIISRWLIYVLLISLFLKLDKNYVVICILLLSLITLLYLFDIADEDGSKKQVNRILKSRGGMLNESENDGIIGYYDSNGELVFNKSSPVFTEISNEGSNSLFTYDELSKFEKESCKKPTLDNPFMNNTIYEYNSGDIPKACNVGDDEVISDVEMKFDEMLYKDFDDRYATYNLRRQFYTKPHNLDETNTTTFANWLYGTDKTCKTDNYCIRNSDLRYNRS